MLVFHTAGVPYKPAGKGSCLDPYFTQVRICCLLALRQTKRVLLGTGESAMYGGLGVETQSRRN
jgi:hypothetical protein